MRLTCNDCMVKDNCQYDKRARMYKKRCYIDDLANVMKKSQQWVIDLVNKFSEETGYEVYDIIPDDSNDSEWWQGLKKVDKRNEIIDRIYWMQTKRKKWDAQYIPCPEKEVGKYCTLIVTLLDVYFGIERNRDFVRCLRCGQLFENNRQHNRKYCDNCKGYQQQNFIWRICPDCGENFKVNAPNNRQYRCTDCQKEADKRSARQRAKNYRERRNHGIN